MSSQLAHHASDTGPLVRAQCMCFREQAHDHGLHSKPHVRREYNNAQGSQKKMMLTDELY
jgi:hypothetical protein